MCSVRDNRTQQLATCVIQVGKWNRMRQVASTGRSIKEMARRNVRRSFKMAPTVHLQRSELLPPCASSWRSLYTGYYDSLPALQQHHLRVATVEFPVYAVGMRHTVCIVLELTLMRWMFPHICKGLRIRIVRAHALQSKEEALGSL